MRGRLRVRVVVGTVAAYLAVLVFLAGSGTAALAFGVVYFAVTAGVAHALYLREVALMKGDEALFNRNLPFKHFGWAMVDFEHVFCHSDDLLAGLLTEMKTRLKERASQELEEIRRTDMDKELSKHDVRTFFRSTAEPTVRGTSVTVVVHASRQAQMQSIHWWILLSGFIDPNRLVVFEAMAPLTLPLWIRSYLRREYDLLANVRNVYSAFYNELDVVTRVRCVHEVAIDTVVDHLEAHGVDTSDLKVRRAQLLNVSITGSGARIGSIIQGAANRVVSAPNTGRAA